MSLVTDLAVLAVVLFVLYVGWKLIKPWIPYSEEWARRRQEELKSEKKK